MKTPRNKRCQADSQETQSRPACLRLRPTAQAPCSRAEQQLSLLPATPRHAGKRDAETTGHLQKRCLITKNGRTCRYERISLEFLLRGQWIYRSKIHAVSQRVFEGKLEKCLKLLHCSHGAGNSDPSACSR